MHNWISLVLVLATIYAMNIPFGYWRFKEKKLSLMWFLTIHVPIPFIFVLRSYFQVEHGWVNTPLLVVFFFGGQKTGMMIHQSWARKIPTGKFIFMDIFKHF